MYFEEKHFLVPVLQSKKAYKKAQRQFFFFQEIYMNSLSPVCDQFYILYIQFGHFYFQTKTNAF